MKIKLKLREGQSVWFTSDSHYHHPNICSATTKWINPVTIREFKSLEHMNATIVENINEFVGQDDILFHLGDWSFGGFDKTREFRDRLVCNNIHLVLGNHDDHIEKNKDGIRSLFASVNEYVELEVNYPWLGSVIHNFVLMHFPIASWNHLTKGHMHLHGHLHLKKNVRANKGKMMDVGVDGNDMYPIGLKEVVSILGNRPLQGMFEFDHHKK